MLFWNQLSILKLCWCMPKRKVGVSKVDNYIIINSSPVYLSERLFLSQKITSCCTRQGYALLFIPIHRTVNNNNWKFIYVFACYCYGTKLPDNIKNMINAVSSEVKVKSLQALGIDAWLRFDLAVCKLCDCDVWMVM